MMGDARFSRLNSPAREKWVLDESGPERATADWPRVSLVQSLPLAALPELKPERAASVPAGRHSSRRLPCNWLPPLLVTMLTTLPVDPPNSAEKALVSTVISCTESSGRVLKVVWRPQLSLSVLPSTTKVVWRRPAPLVVKRFWFMKTSPWLMAGRLAAFRSGR